LGGGEGEWEWEGEGEGEGGREKLLLTLAFPLCPLLSPVCRE
jgi:hypothetical protein